VAARCRFNSVGGRRIGEVTYPPVDLTCPGARNVLAQRREFNGVEYEDYDARGQVASDVVPGQPQLRTVVAQTASEYRDDRALKAFGVVQEVTYGGGAQLAQGRPLRKFRTPVYAGPANRGWDLNIDGLANEGLLPDAWQDLRNVGVTWEQLGPLFSSAEDFVAMWERACRLSVQWHRARGLTPPPGCE
jgi:hypothetical protein